MDRTTHTNIYSGMSRLIRLIMWLGRCTVDTVKLQWGIERLAMSTG